MTQEFDVLVVEDNAADLELILYALRTSALSNRIQVARDGEEALDFLFCRGAYSGRSFEPPPKLVLLDLKMPRLGGVEVLGQMRSDPRTKAIPVVVLTSSKDERDLVESYHLGVNSYIYKPTAFEEFREAVKQVGQYWLRVNRPPPSNAFSA